MFLSVDNLLPFDMVQEKVCACEQRGAVNWMKQRKYTVYTVHVI